MYNETKHRGLILRTDKANKKIGVIHDIRDRLEQAGVAYADENGVIDLADVKIIGGTVAAGRGKDLLPEDVEDFISVFGNEGTLAYKASSPIKKEM